MKQRSFQQREVVVESLQLRDNIRLHPESQVRLITGMDFQKQLNGWPACELTFSRGVPVTLYVDDTVFLMIDPKEG